MTARQQGAGPVAAEAAPPGDGRAGATPGRDARRLGAGGWAKWGWRQLTSMRTALVLLFLLALASIPGSLLPQQSIDPAAVTSYYTAHPALAPVLNRLSLFNVFGAPWFAAVYLLLFASLAGCVLPRAFSLGRSARQQPPRAPRNLARLPHAVRGGSSASPEAAVEAAAALLAAKRFRLRTGDGWVSAEKGYLREVGNLVFHLALLGVLAAVAMGGLWGYKANRLLVAGDTFANTPVALDVFHPGRLVTPADLQPFSVHLTRFSAGYVTAGPQLGEPSWFSARVRYSSEPGSPQRSFNLRVNHPLIVDGVRVYLIGHGYAPEFRLTQANGQVVFDDAVPFIPVEQAGLTSEGVIKVPDASPEQLGFAGVFLPTAVDVDGQLRSAFPAALRPRVSLVSYAGNLEAGQTQSVYQLNTAHLQRLPVAPAPLAPGQSIRLPHGLGTLTFTGYRQWASLAITYDPGQVPLLISAIVALAGLILSFLVRRRRVFVRAYAGPDGATVVEVGGLARSDAAGGFEAEFDELGAQLLGGQPGRQATATAGAGQAGASPSTTASPGAGAAQDPALAKADGK